MEFKLNFGIWTTQQTRPQSLIMFKFVYFLKNPRHFSNLKYWEEWQIVRGMVKKFLCHFPYCPSSWCYWIIPIATSLKQNKIKQKTKQQTQGHFSNYIQRFSWKKELHPMALLLWQTTGIHSQQFPPIHVWCPPPCPILGRDTIADLERHKVGDFFSYQNSSQASSNWETREISWYHFFYPWPVPNWIICKNIVIYVKSTFHCPNKLTSIFDISTFN